MLREEQGEEDDHDHQEEKGQDQHSHVRHQLHLGKKQFYFLKYYKGKRRVSPLYLAVLHHQFWPVSCPCSPDCPAVWLVLSVLRKVVDGLLLVGVVAGGGGGGGVVHCGVVAMAAVAEALLNVKGGLERWGKIIKLNIISCNSNNSNCSSNNNSNCSSNNNSNCSSSHNNNNKQQQLRQQQQHQVFSSPVC